MTSKTVYLSGPMRGIPMFNFPAFDEVEFYASVRRGWSVFSPAAHDRQVWPGVVNSAGFATGTVSAPDALPGTPFDAPEDYTFRNLFPWDVEAISKSDAIVLLPGWENSTGAKLELEIAKAMQLEVLYAVFGKVDAPIWETWCRDIVADDPAAPQIIGLMGYAQSGKDSTGKILANYGFKRLAFADALREFLYAQNPLVRQARNPRESWRRGTLRRLQDVVDSLGWERAKVEWPEIRKLLQRTGTEAGRQIIGEDVWRSIVLKQLRPHGRYVITDVRFADEAQAILDVGGELWLIERPGYGPLNDHASEQIPAGYATVGICATDLDELREKVTTIVGPRPVAIA